MGIKSASEGTLDIGAASRELKDSEKSGLVASVLAYDGIAVVTNAAQTVANLSIEQIKQIFAEKSPTGVKSAVLRHCNSITRRARARAAFEEMVMGKTLISASAILQSSTGALKTTVAGNKKAIGYISMGYLDSSVKALSIDGVAGTEANAKNGSYPIVRPLLYVTKGNPQGIVKKFIDFCRGIAGQAIVAEDYISIL